MIRIHGDGREDETFNVQVQPYTKLSSLAEKVSENVHWTYPEAFRSSHWARSLEYTEEEV